MWCLCVLPKKRRKKKRKKGAKRKTKKQRRRSKFFFKSYKKLGRRVNQKKWPKNIEIFVSISKFLKIPKSGVCKPNHEKFRNFILRIFLETRTTFSLFFKLNNSALVHEIFGRLFSIHRVKSIQKSLNYSSYLDSIVFNRCRSARARVSIFDEFRSVFRGNFEKSEKFRNGERRKFRNFIFFLVYTPMPYLMTV